MRGEADAAVDDLKCVLPTGAFESTTIEPEDDDHLIAIHAKAMVEVDRSSNSERRLGRLAEVRLGERSAAGSISELLDDFLSPLLRWSLSSSSRALFSASARRRFFSSR